ncbi:hypothetical protein [Paraburkholderia ultramafica]|uniref:hypothetical protein n=1 Tax=Paraburkholderia ultramafica TaxID=1544867 RepID=UPI001FE9BDE8|nr:hypothetical protein [Paraburkholderia ultramafica]
MTQRAQLGPASTWISSCRPVRKIKLIPGLRVDDGLVLVESGGALLHGWWGHDLDPVRRQCLDHRSSAASRIHRRLPMRVSQQFANTSIATSTDTTTSAISLDLYDQPDALSHGLLDGMGEADAQELLRLLRKFVHLNNDQSRAPLRSSGDDAISG